MAGEHFEDDWADTTAKWTFILTVVSVVLFVGAVFLFIF